MGVKFIFMYMYKICYVCSYACERPYTTYICIYIYNIHIYIYIYIYYILYNIYTLMISIFMNFNLCNHQLHWKKSLYLNFC